MEIRYFSENEVLVIELNGRLDESSARELADVAASVISSSAPRVVLDMAQVEYISSGGLRVVLMLQKAIDKNNGTLKFCGLNPFVAEVFATSNLLPLFDVYNAREEALDAF